MFRLRPNEKRIIKRSGEFDYQFYANANPDVVAAGFDLLDHYLLHGRLEGRKPSIEFDPIAYLEANPDLDPKTVDPLLHYIRHGKKEGRPIATRIPTVRRFPIEKVPGMALDARQEESLEKYHGQLKALLQSSYFTQKFHLIQRIERCVTSERLFKANIPPCNDPSYFVHRAIRQRLSKLHYDTIVCLPSVPLNREDLVAGLMAKTLCRLRPNETVLLIKTHVGDARWIGIFPNPTDTLDLSDLLPLVSDDAFTDIFLATLLGLTPRRVINVTCRLFFNTCLRYSTQLSRYLHLYSYWDEPTAAEMEKFFSAFVSQCFPHLTAIMTDNGPVVARLVDVHAIPASYRQKIIHLLDDGEQQLDLLFKAETPKASVVAGYHDLAIRTTSGHNAGQIKTTEKATVDISAVLTLHKEGLLCGPTLINFQEAIIRARSAGLKVEGLIICDCSDDLTVSVARQPRFKDFRVELIDAGDPAFARNFAVTQARGQHIAFLDGDDFWCEDWLVACAQYASKLDIPSILHPACNIFFGKDPWVMVHPDSTDPAFDADCLRLANCWTSLCFAARDILLSNKYRYCERKSGFGHEDWSWNCQTLADGIPHRPCPATFHVIREKQFSRSAEYNARNVVPWPTKLTPYA